MVQLQMDNALLGPQHHSYQTESSMTSIANAKVDLIKQSLC